MEQHLESTANTVSASAPHSSGVEKATTSVSQNGISESYRDCASSNTVTSHQLPIPPASEPMQYRAIGLIQGTYVPSEEQFTRGTLMTEDNQPIDAVLLGRVMSLVKKHVDLTVPHLWVVYPRTRPKNEHLHAQIVGIWEPDNLNRDLDDESLDDESEAQDRDQSDPTTVDAAVDNIGRPAEQPVILETQPTVSPEIQTNVIEDRSDADPASVSSESVDQLSAEASQVDDTDVEADTPEEETEANLSAVTPTDSEDGSIKTEIVEPTSMDESSDDSSEASPLKLVKPARPKFSAAAAQAANIISSTTPTPDPEATRPLAAATADPSKTVEKGSFSPSQPILKDGYFSIRGEIIQFSPEDEEITIRIRQASRKGGGSSDTDNKARDDSKEFKLQVQGRLEGRTVGYFWDLQVQREGKNLVVFDSTMIGVVPPRKTNRKKGPGGPVRGGGRGGVKRRFDGGRNEARPGRSDDRPTPATPNRRPTGSKPVLKKNSPSNSGRSAASED